MIHYPDTDCEIHCDVRTEEPVCLICLIEDRDRLREQLEEANQEQGGLPTYLFDGYAVYQALSKKATARTSYDNVSDVLDALVNLARQQPQGGEDE